MTRTSSIADHTANIDSDGCYIVLPNQHHVTDAVGELLDTRVIGAGWRVGGCVDKRIAPPFLARIIAEKRAVMVANRAMIERNL